MSTDQLHSERTGSREFCRDSDRGFGSAHCPIAVICALEFEFQCLVGALRRSRHTVTDSEVSSGPPAILLRRCGVGPSRARAATCKALSDGARSVLSWGVAGSLDSRVRPGTVVLASAVRLAGGKRIPTDMDWRRRLWRVLSPHTAVHEGELVSVEGALCTPQAKAAGGTSGAVAVDMESAAIGEGAVLARRRFAVIRVILDGVGDRLPETSQLIDSTGRIGPAGLAPLLCRPAQWVPLLLAARRFRRARLVLNRCASILAAEGLV